MQPYVDGVALEGVAGIGTPGVCPGRALEPARIIAVGEVVVALRVRTELRIVTVRGKREWRPGLPAADHLRPEQRLLPPVGGTFAQVSAVGGDAGVQLAEHHI